MRSVVLVFGLLSLCWAQNQKAPRRTARVPVVSGQKVKPRVSLPKPQAVYFDLGEQRGSSLHLRTRTATQINFPWLQDYQDTETVPSNPNIGSFQGDTLLSNGSLVCSPHTFFDSLLAKGAWVVYNPGANGATFYGNYLHGNPDLTNDTVFYLGGGIAERYDFNLGPNDSIAIIGVASQILNNFNNRSNPTSVCTTVNSSDTVSYVVYDTVEVAYPAYYDPNTLISGTYPANEIIRATKRYDQIRIGYLVSAGNCILQQTNRLERLDYIYFDQKVNIYNPISYYVAVEYTPYVPGADALNDTLFGLIGPSFAPGDPCTSGDTTFAGRNVVKYTGYIQSANSFLYDWYDQYNAFSGGGYDLNFLLFPILGPADARTTTSLSPVIRSGKVEFGLPYPNPATDCVKLVVKAPATLSASLKLYDVDGRLVANLGTRTLTAGENTLSMDLPATIRSGSYLLAVQTPVGSSSFVLSVVR
ncbi:MAG: T9SS type A sorting domain-containing protein [Bacteroidia bacterium]